MARSSDYPKIKPRIIELKEKNLDWYEILKIIQEESPQASADCIRRYMRLQGLNAPDPVKAVKERRKKLKEYVSSKGAITRSQIYELSGLYGSVSRQIFDKDFRAVFPDNFRKRNKSSVVLPDEICRRNKSSIAPIEKKEKRKTKERECIRCHKTFTTPVDSRGVSLHHYCETCFKTVENIIASKRNDFRI